MRGRALPFVRTGLAFLPACGGASSDGSTTGGATTTGDTGTAATSEAGADGPVDASTTTTGVAMCAPDETCIAAAPDGWIGPFLYAQVPRGRNEPPCPEALPEPVPVVHAGFHPPAPTICECACEPHEAAECYAQLYTHDTIECTDFGYDNVSPTESCTNFALDGFFELYSFGYGSDGACDAFETESIPPVEFDARIHGCGVSPTATACAADRVCAPSAPAGFESAWCIARAGEHDCPPGDASVREVVWTDLEDTRACTRCTCGFIGTSCSELVVDIYGGLDCGGVPVQSAVVNGGCTFGFGQSLVIRTSARSPCPIAEPPAPTGAATPTGPITFCCTDD